MSSSNGLIFKRLILIFILFFSMAGFASAYEFIFTGNVSYANGTYAPSVNVSLSVPSWVSQQAAYINGTWSNNTDANGNFRVNVSFGNSAATEAAVQGMAMLTLLIRRNAGDGNFTQIGPTLPDFPASMFSGSQAGMPSLINQTFYLRRAATVRLAAINTTGSAQNFSYNIKDRNLGTQIVSSMVFPPTQSTFNIALELTRNYSVDVYFNNAPPLNINILSLTDWNYSGSYTIDPNNVSTLYFYNYTFNTSVSPQYVDGYIINSSADYIRQGTAVVNNSKFEIWMTNLEGGNFVCAEDNCLNNLTQFQSANDLKANGGGVYINLTSGYYNMSLPGTTTSSSFVLFVLINDSNGNWSLGVQNITKSYGDVTQTRQNITLYPIAGSKSSNFISGSNLKSPMTLIRLLNSTGGAITSQGFVEMTLDYGLGFDMKIGMQTNTSGIATFPLVTKYGIKKLKVFISQYPPRDTSFGAAAMDGDINVTLYSMQVKSFDSSSNLGSTMQMLISNSTCDVMNPPSNCILSSAADSSFNPFTAILRGAISMRMLIPGGLILHYRNVDLISSGPPDFISDSAATSTSSVTGKLSDVWRFGSRGPKISDNVFIGLNYSGAPIVTSTPIYVQIPLLYDSDGNIAWNITANGSNFNAIKGNLTEYTDYNETFFNETNGRLCNTTGTLGNNMCFYNSTQQYMWISLPHFSNVGSTVSGITAGNVSLNVSGIVYCNSFCDFYFNVTNLNFTLSLYLINWTINFTANASAGNVNTNIYYLNLSNLSQFVLNGTNVSYNNGYNFTYYNSSDPAHTVHQFWMNLTRSSNKTARTTLNFSFNSNDGGRYDLTVQLNLTCIESWSYTAWSTCSSSLQTRTATDASACGTTTDRAALSQSCTSTNAGVSTGGGGVTSTQMSNLWPTMDSGVTYTYPIGKADQIINTITVVPNTHLANVKLVVNQYSAKPTDILREPVGEVYKYLQVVKENILNSQIEKSIVTFTVAKSWVDAKGKVKDVTFLKYNNGVWEVLSTKYLGASASGDYQFESDTKGFSYFAVAYQTTEQQAVQKQQTKLVIEGSGDEAVNAGEVDTTKAENVFDSKQARTTNWTTIVLVLAILLVIGVVFYFVFKHKKKAGLSSYRYRPGIR